jgi:hypothetical protein
MSDNQQSAPFPVSGTFQPVPVDGDNDSSSTTPVERDRAPEGTVTRFAIVAGVLAVSAAIVYAFVRYAGSTADGTNATRTALLSRDHDAGKGAIEDDRPSEGSNAPGLEQNGMPDEEPANTQDALSARMDGTQG